MRFVKGTSSLLGFTKYDKTCVLEFDEVVFKHQDKFIIKLANELKNNKILFTFHIGKLNPYGNNPDFFKYLHGPDLELWKKKRAEYLTDKEIEVFSSEYSNAIGLKNDPRSGYDS